MRKRLISLTDRGYQILEQSLPYWRKAQEQVMARLGQSQWDALRALLPCWLAWSQPLLPNWDHPMQRLELFAQRDLPSSRDAIRTAASRSLQRL